MLDGRRRTKPEALRSTPPELPSPEVVYRHFIKGLRERNNAWAWGRCPFHDDCNPSFCVNFITGYYRCSVPFCAKHGPDIVSFVSKLIGLSRKEAGRYLQVQQWR
jgi:hypothetical protein